MIVDIRAERSRAAAAGEERALPIEPAGDAGFGPGFAEVPLDLGSFADPADDAPPPGRAVAAIVAALAVIGWLGGVMWLAGPAIPMLHAAALVEFVGALCVVPALIGVIWLLALRTSRTEARRFARTGSAMRAEAASLERTLAVMSASIAANRAALGEQITQLMNTGDVATERLASIGRRMADEIAEADLHARGLADAAAAAKGSIDIVLASLPHAQSETRAVAALLDQAGLSASEQAAALDAQIVALATHAREAETLADGAAQRLAAHITRMEATSETAGTRLEATAADMSSAVDGLLGRTADAIDEARKGIAAQGDAMLAMVGANQAMLDSGARASADAFAERIADIERAVDGITDRLDAQRRTGESIVAGLDDSIAATADRLGALHTQGIDRSQILAASISALGGSANAMTEALRTGDAMATRTIGTTESLLIALDAATREIDETLPDALDRLDTRIAASKAIVVQAKPELLALVTAAESTHDAIEAIAGVIADQRRTLDQLSSALIDTLTQGRSKADALGQMVDETIGRTHRFAEEAAPRLIEALLRVRDTAAVAADKARETLATVIPDAADALEAASVEAMRRATGDTVERQIRAIGDATDAAVDAATRATARLSIQVQAIADQTAIVETRIEDARAEREESDRDTFARRVSLLIESLNSASIDVARILAPDISDSAWAAYLKGDRGVFTRRAVRVLEAGEAREIVRLYDDDTGFRDHVNRYIHDFEAMLRAVLAQRDGSPLGVTLLSSDMGKLYVALAQAIERLR
ncbi:hypothetical protein [Sphingomonas bacterium]|uniref:hypothetical protein n=1 Tax=Sphingomonas bacterium TaxID=1895847 RepID=UPI00157571FB|nr:hypothetical protein [Sphingomonas bacterium]